jgi:hypothetical protein
VISRSKGGSVKRGSASLKRDICDRQDRALGKMEGTIGEMERVERVEARLGAMEETLLAIFREVKR